jgi:hypothetical protein
VLLIAVEIAPDIHQDPNEIRKVIGQELHRPVVSPREHVPESTDMLIVFVGRNRIFLSLHQRSDEQVSRSVATPLDKEARLRNIAWLAGNVARDQVSPLLTLFAPVASPAEQRLEISPTPISPAPSPTPEPVSTEPPPLSLQPTPRSSVRTASNDLISQPTEAASPSPGLWTMTAAAGPASLRAEYSQAASLTLHPSIQLELERRRSDDWLWGVALDFGPTPVHGLGLAVLGGRTWRWRRFTLDVSAGLGIETALAPHQSAVLRNSPPSGTTTETAVTVDDQAMLFARGFVTASYPFARAWDVVLRTGAHTAVTGKLYGSFETVTVGARLHLP